MSYLTSALNYVTSKASGGMLSISGDNENKGGISSISSLEALGEISKLPPISIGGVTSIMFRPRISGRMEDKANKTTLIERRIEITRESIDPQTQSEFSKLPGELIKRVIGLLDAKDKKIFSNICKLWFLAVYADMYGKIRQSDGVLEFFPIRTRSLTLEGKDKKGEAYVKAIYEQALKSPKELGKVSDSITGESFRKKTQEEKIEAVEKFIKEFEVHFAKPIKALNCVGGKGKINQLTDEWATPTNGSRWGIEDQELFLSIYQELSWYVCWGEEQALLSKGIFPGLIENAKKAMEKVEAIHQILYPGKTMHEKFQNLTFL